jgi:hypothetical protein
MHAGILAIYIERLSEEIKVSVAIEWRISAVQLPSPGIAWLKIISFLRVAFTQKCGRTKAGAYDN